MSHPYALDPTRWDKALSEVPDKGMSLQPLYLPLSQTWSGPFVMALINELVVRRSSTLLGLSALLSLTIAAQGCAFPDASLLFCSAVIPNHKSLE